MKLLFRQRIFSWFDSYDIYDEWGNTVYMVRGQLSWGHLLKIYDARGYAVGTVRERVLTFLPKFEMYLGDRYMGCVRKRFSFFRPVFDLDCNGWQVEGDWFEWDYDIRSARGARVATISKQLFRWFRYLCDRRCRPEPRAVRSDGGSGDRCGEMLPQQLIFR